MNGYGWFSENLDEDRVVLAIQLPIEKWIIGMMFRGLGFFVLIDERLCCGKWEFIQETLRILEEEIVEGDEKQKERISNFIANLLLII